MIQIVSKSQALILQRLFAISCLSTACTPAIATQFSSICEQNAPTVGAVVQYLVASKSLFAWRERKNADASVCIEQDFPRIESGSKILSAANARALYAQMNAQHQAQAQRIRPLLQMQQPIEVLSSPDLFVLGPPNAHIGPETLAGKQCAPRKAANTQKFWRLADQDLSFAARIAPAQCDDGLSISGGGSAVFLGPALAMTAAHIVRDAHGEIHCAYRAVPGGAAYTAHSAQPYGAYFSKSIRGGKGARAMFARLPDELSSVALSEYVALDYAFLHLAVDANVSNLQSFESRIWPAFVFSDAASPTPRVYKSGYPRENAARNLRAPGASVTADGAQACVSNSAVQAFSMVTFAGDSGAPIWIHPDDDARGWLSVISVVSVGEINHLRDAYAFGPRFTLGFYQKVLAQLR